MVPLPMVVRHELVEHADQALLPEETRGLDRDSTFRYI